MPGMDRRAMNTRSVWSMPMNGNCSRRRKLFRPHVGVVAPRDVGQCADRQPKPTIGRHLAREQIVGPACQGRRELGHPGQRQTEQLGTFDQGIEIALRLGQLGVEPALAQAESRKHDPLRA